MPSFSALDHSPSSTERHSVYGWLLGVIWLAAYSLFFYSFTLPNSEPATSRLDVWRQLPDILLTCVLPAQDGPPSGWTYFPQRIDLLLVAAMILAGAWGLGHLVLRFAARSIPSTQPGTDGFRIRIRLVRPVADHSWLWLAELAVSSAPRWFPGRLLRWRMVRPNRAMEDSYEARPVRIRRGVFRNGRPSVAIRLRK